MLEKLVFLCQTFESGSSSEFGASQASQLVYAQAAMVEANKLQLEQSMGRSRPLAIQLLCHMKETPSKQEAAKI